MTTEHKLPKITTEIDHAVTVGELPEIREWMKEVKPHLKEYAKLLIDKVEEQQKIGWYRIFEIEATFYNDHDLPVLRIAGKAFDWASASGRAVIFIEVFADESDSEAVRYTRVEKKNDGKE